MEISIITPVYNSGEIILETFKSLSNQTFTDFEWIIIDDCSNRNTKDVLQIILSEAKFNVTLIQNEINSGQTRSKNLGIKKAKGKYIKFLDSDDLLDECHLENQMDILTKKGKSVAVFSPTANFITSIENVKLNKSYRTVKQSNIEQLKRFIVFPFFSHCGCLFNIEDINEIGGFDESLVTDEDGDLIIRLMFNKVLFIPQEKSCYYYRQHAYFDRVSTNDTDEKWESRERVCEKIHALININSLQVLNESLSQRLDLLGVAMYNSSKSKAQVLFFKASKIYIGYRYPGSLISISIRKYFGLAFFMKTKTIKDYFTKVFKYAV